MQNGKIRELGRDASPKVTVNIFPLGESLPTSLTLGCQLQARDISRRNHTFCATVRQVRRCPRWNKVHDEHRRVWINSWWRSLAGRPRSVAGQRSRERWTNPKQWNERINLSRCLIHNKPTTLHDNYVYRVYNIDLPEKSGKCHWSRVRASVFFGNNEISKRRERGGKMERINSNFIIYVNPSRI